MVRTSFLIYVDHLKWFSVKPILTLSLLLLAIYRINAQITQISNIQHHYLILDGDTSLYSENSILPSTVEIEGQYQDSADVTINNNSLIISTGQVDTLHIMFRTMPFNIAHSTSIIDSSSMESDLRFGLIDSDYEEELKRRRFIQSNKLEYSGSFSRGVSFGNSQDVVLNSNFNMQMKGDLGNGLFVRAAISDENIPIQPEGNTQVLQEFDKIFIEVQKDRTSIIAGDYELSKPDSYFMNYFKKLKGISVSNQTNINSEWTTTNRASFAISRGQFNRQFIDIQEGNQGPYRLLGAANEIFIQVLSGTEKVYADGRLLTRGEKNDYVIDYNRSEIRFTPNLIINANLRIIVEFEYTVQRYLRSLYATESTIENDKWRFKVNLYNEQDSKSLTSNIELDTTDIRILTEGGDNNTFRSGIFIPTEGASEDIIRYRIQPDGTLVYAPEPEEGLVSALFTNVGDMMGSYVIDTDIAANGRVYTFVGENNGNYDPVINLVPPQTKQLTTFAAGYSISDSTDLYVEASLSNVDLNRFSEVDNNDNTGVAVHSNFSDIRILNRENNTLLKSNFNFEYASEYFQALNPYRVQEFSRDWNIDFITQKSDQILYNATVGVNRQNNYASYTFSGFHDRGLYDGNKHIGEVNYLNSGWYINGIFNLLTSQSSAENTNFIRPKGTISKSLFDRKIKVGTYFEKEQNRRRDARSDSLRNTSFNYDLIKGFIDVNLSESLTITGSIIKRYDDRGIDNIMQRISESTNYELSGNWQQGTNSTLVWQLVLRDYIVEDIFIDQDKSNKSFIGNIDHKLNLLKNGLSLSTYYEANSGQEPRLEFQYIRVQEGEGSYLWNDYNEDGIEQITEFEIAVFPNIGGFEKISIFNNEFISTNRNVLNQSLKLDPSKFLKKKNNLLSRFIITSRYRIDQKLLNQDDGGFVEPISFDLENDNLVSFAATFDHNLFFNRGNPKYDIQLAYRSLNNKLAQISGDETRLNDQYYTRTRINLKRKVDILMETSIGTKKNDNSIFDSQDFTIDFWSLIPQLNIRPSNKMRIILKYKIEKNRNRIGLLESSDINDGGIDFTWRQNSQSNLQLEFNVVHIDFVGVRNTPIEFEMLQGLRNGRNLVWNFNYTKRLSNNIDLMVNYNGRKSEDSRLVHTAGVQMRAIF